MYMNKIETGLTYGVTASFGASKFDYLCFFLSSPLFFPSGADERRVFLFLAPPLGGELASGAFFPSWLPLGGAGERSETERGSWAVTFLLSNASRGIPLSGPATPVHLPSGEARREKSARRHLSLGAAGWGGDALFPGGSVFFRDLRKEIVYQAANALVKHGHAHFFQHIPDKGEFTLHLRFGGGEHRRQQP